MLAISSATHKSAQASNRIRIARNLRITHRVDERLPCLGPVLFVVELARVPHHLVHELWQTDGVAGGTGPGGLEAACAGVGDVTLMVRRVEVLAVPASRCCCQCVGGEVRGSGGVGLRWESNGRSDTAGARLFREGGRVIARAGGAAEGRLFDVVLAAVAYLLLHALLGATAGLSN